MAGRLGPAARWAMALGALFQAGVLARAADSAALPSFRHRLAPDVAARVEPVVLAAAQRFAAPECSQLLDDFADARGRLLRERLSVLAADPEAYVGLVVFVDGRNYRACQRSAVIAVTNPGTRIVGLCPAFYRAVRNDRGLAEGIVIHETLHTLGLEENPPSSREINERVFQRCGRFRELAGDARLRADGASLGNGAR
jgi:hypothetical protein